MNYNINVTNNFRFIFMGITFTHIFYLFYLLTLVQTNYMPNHNILFSYTYTVYICH